MMKLYTIGFTKKNARQFFELLMNNQVKTVCDVRLNNNSQLAGFTKSSDLPYFLEKIGNIKYVHWVRVAPEKELLKKWQKKEISWRQYEEEYLTMLMRRNIQEMDIFEQLDRGCLLCSEPTAEQCHRRLLAEYLKNSIPDLEIIHL
ncbi:DUF488 domain-containing protein [Methanogenium cariaci]|jgi:uncharacterized protein (DUF488 family)